MQFKIQITQIKVFGCSFILNRISTWHLHREILIVTALYLGKCFLVGLFWVSICLKLKQSESKLSFSSVSKSSLSSVSFFFLFDLDFQISSVKTYSQRTNKSLRKILSEDPIFPILNNPVLANDSTHIVLRLLDFATCYRQPVKVRREPICSFLN